MHRKPFERQVVIMRVDHGEVLRIDENVSIYKRDRRDVLVGADSCEVDFKICFRG